MCWAGGRGAQALTIFGIDCSHGHGRCFPATRSRAAHVEPLVLAVVVLHGVAGPVARPELGAAVVRPGTDTTPPHPRVVRRRWRGSREKPRLYVPEDVADGVPREAPHVGLVGGLQRRDLDWRTAKGRPHKNGTDVSPTRPSYASAPPARRTRQPRPPVVRVSPARPSYASTPPIVPRRSFVPYALVSHAPTTLRYAHVPQTTVCR